MMWTSEKQFWAHCSFSTYGLCDLKHGIYFLKLGVFIWVGIVSFSFWFSSYLHLLCGFLQVWLQGSERTGEALITWSLLWTEEKSSIFFFILLPAEVPWGSPQLWNRLSEALLGSPDFRI